MKDARIVFVGIGVLALLPFLFQIGKNIWFAVKGKAAKRLWMRIIAFSAVSVAIALLIVSLYRFTIGYEAPLVAEQFHKLFMQRVDGLESLEEYLRDIEAKDLAISDFAFVSNEDIESSNLVPGEYSVALSENIYENEDGSITIYARYQRDDVEVYTALKLEMNNNRWRAVEHRLLTEEDLNEAGLQKRFYEIK